MPRLSAFRDNDELDNAIADKTIVYVEGPDDVSFFTALSGPDVRDRLEFKTPEAGTGYHEVKARVAELRPTNPKVHGLLDGEAAVAFGEVGAFIDANGAMFGIDVAALDGLLFLAEYEVENLLLCHTKLARFIANDVAVAELGSRTEAGVQAAINTLVLRYVLFSIIKFTMIAFHREDRPCKGVGKIGGQFLDREVGSANLMRNEVRQEIAAQVDWGEFLAAMHDLVRAIRDGQEQRGLDDPARRRDAFRLADGKLLLKHVRKQYSGTKKWDGHLHDHLIESGYCLRFREALLAATDTPIRRAA